MHLSLSVSPPCMSSVSTVHYPFQVQIIKPPNLMRLGSVHFWAINMAMLIVILATKLATLDSLHAINTQTQKCI